jgi:hypothetical protein
MCSAGGNVVSWYNGCSVGGELFVVVIVVVIVQSEGCVLFRSRRRDHVGVTNMGEVSMGGYLPHIVTSTLVDLQCTLLSQ